MAGGILGSLVGGAISSVLPGVLPDISATARILVDRLVPDPAAREAAQKEIEDTISTREALVVQAVQEQNKAQADLNLAEAQGNDRFSSRWRPALGWACVAAFVYQFLGAPIFTYGFGVLGVALGIAFPAAPQLPVADFMPVLLGMLGLGTMRSYERTRGVPGAMPGGVR